MIKYCGSSFKISLLKLFNLCLSYHVWPWTISKMIFLKKPGKNTYNNPSDYRPITISSYLSKLFEKLIYNRLIGFMEDNNLLEFAQEGFRKYRSCARYLFSLANHISSSLEANSECLTLMCDFSKAFDSVWIKGLLFKLFHSGINGDLWTLLANFLLNRKVFLDVNDFMSDIFLCNFGVPQGSVLAP